MDSRSENLIAVTEPDSSDAVEACAKPVKVSAQGQQPQPSILDLNSLLFIILTGLAAVLIVAAFLVSTR